MIRLIQRRLIIPRGDTGTFSIPMLPGKDAGDVSIFTIFDPLVHRKVFEKSMNLAEGVLNIEFTHNDTVNLPVGQYVWDIKFYSDPQFVDGKLVNGTEIDSYYAAFALPVCEIRETGDSLLTDDNAPQATLAPDQLDIITAAITEVQAAERQAVDSAAEANASAGDAETAAAAAQASERAALESQNAAEEAQRVAENSAAAAQESMEQAQQIAQQIHEEIPTKVSDLVDDSGHYIKPETGIPASDLEEAYLTSFTETDPTVPAWAKQPQKPTYTAQEVGALPADTVIPTVPTNVSAFTNDAGYLTEHQDISGKANAADLAAVATSGSYNDLEDKPVIPSKISDLTDDSGHYTKPASGIPASDLANGVLDVWSGLTYHTSTMSTDSDSFVLGGATDAPTEINKCLVTSTPSANVIPKFDYQGRLHSVTPEEEWDGSNAVATTEYVDNMISDNMPEVPTAVSELENDAGYITGYTETDPTVPTWAKAAQKPTYTAAEVGAPTVQEMNTAIGNAISNINSFDMAVVQTLPTENISTHTIYLVPKTGETNDVYDEYVYINNAWEMVGNTQVDLSNYVQKTDYATSTTAGVVKVNQSFGLNINQAGYIGFVSASDSDIRYWSTNTRTITPATQHAAVFYGLARAAGDLTQPPSENAVGTYTNEAKAAIRSMIGAAASADVTVQDVQIEGSSILSNGIANIPMMISNGQLGLIAYNPTMSETGLQLGQNLVGNNYLKLFSAPDALIKSANNNQVLPVIIANQHKSVFYGLAKAAGDTTQSQSNNVVGTYTAEAKAAIQQMLDVPSNADLALKADKTDTVLETTLSRGRKDNTTVGGASLAFGIDTEASGYYSVALGLNTTASSQGAFAEGKNTVAHYIAHAEGENTQALGQYSHSQGIGTIANGAASFAGGGYTIANGHASFVFGRYNAADSYDNWPTWTANTSYEVGDRVKRNLMIQNEPTDVGYHCTVANSDATFDYEHWELDGYRMNYVEIVGNGREYEDPETHQTVRAGSNAYALEWNGTAHYMGNIYVGANADSTGGTKVLCEADFATTQDIQNIINGGVGA